MINRSQLRSTTNMSRKQGKGSKPGKPGKDKKDKVRTYFDSKDKFIILF